MIATETPRFRLPPWLPSRSDGRGLGLALALGLTAMGLTRVLPPTPFLSEVLLALVLGAFVLNTPLRRVLGLALPGPDGDPDEYAPGLRYTGTWVLRLGIVLMGLKVQTSFFHRGELALVGGVMLVTLPSTFFVAHALGAALGVRRPLSDVLAAGTMICGASAVNAVAPVSRAHRHEQATAIAVISVFSVLALIVFRPLAVAVGLPQATAGLWGGLAVNDLSSAIAVGAQMGGAGGVMAAASKSARIVMLAPLLVLLSLVRRDGAPVGFRQRLLGAVPGFVLGYAAFAVLRAVLDRVVATSGAYSALLAADHFAVDLCMATVSAAMGLHLALGLLVSSSPRALFVGGAASVWMAALTLGLLSSDARGLPEASALLGAAALAISFAIYRVTTRAERQLARLRLRFEGGAPLSLGEAQALLDLEESQGPLGDDFLRRLMVQLHPSIGELMPIRKSPLSHGEGCRWVTYWQGKSGWALVAIAREPGATTPVHAHPHRLLGKAIEGALEELRFREVRPGELELVSRGVLGHEELVEADGLAALHVVRAVGQRPALDLQLRGPELGMPGRQLATTPPVDVLDIDVGARFTVTESIDARPGHAGEGQGAGLVTGAR